MVIKSHQNRRQEVFNREALRFCGGALDLCGVLDILKIDKTYTDLQCFMFQFGGAWSFVWGAKPTVAPRGDGTESHNGFATVRELKYASQHCSDKTMDDKMALYRECCFPNCTKSW